MRLAFTVTVEVEHTEGKFASKDDLADQITDWLEGANEGSLTGENEGQYDVTDWTVVHDAAASKSKRGKAE